MSRIALEMSGQLNRAASMSVAGNMAHPLRDSFGRSHSSLRVSLTDRCNLRCGYCMEEEATFLPAESLLKKKELLWVVSTLVELGVKRVRLTGGEPLLRRDLDEIVFDLKSISGIEELTLTTNGILLEKWAEKLKKSGLDRLTISLDTLDPAVFKRLTRRDELGRVLAGVEAGISAGFQGTAINSVLLRGINEREVGALIEFAHRRGMRPRFIESMPIGAGNYDRGSFISAGELLDLIRDTLGDVAPVPNHFKSATARLFQVKSGLVGIIASVSEPFCGSCDRLRLTADGKFKSCLFSMGETDLLPIIRPEKGSWDRERLVQAVTQAVWHKAAGHEMHAEHFVKPARTMHSIGG